MVSEQHYLWGVTHSDFLKIRHVTEKYTNLLWSKHYCPWDKLLTALSSSMKSQVSHLRNPCYTNTKRNLQSGSSYNLQAALPEFIMHSFPFKRGLGGTITQLTTQHIHVNKWFSKRQLRGTWHWSKIVKTACFLTFKGEWEGQYIYYMLSVISV